MSADWIGAPDGGEAPPSPEPEHEGAAPHRRRSAGPRLFGALLLLLGIGWLAAVGVALWQARPQAELQAIVGWTATASGPLILLGLLWLLLGRTPRRETERFTRAVEAMTSESRALESVLEIVATRIEENHARLRGEAEKLMSLGDEASDRLGRVTHYLSRETATLDKKAAALDSAASAAKVDIGVLLHDLPRAEEQARAVAGAMKEAGLTAHGQASALEAQLGALAARGREADELLGGAAQRMSAHVARIESGGAAAAASLDEASAKMNAVVDAAMGRAGEALEAARSALETQSAATLAAIEQSRAALDRTGEDSARSLAERLDSIGARMDALGGQLAAQETASHALVTGLGRELAELDNWFEQLGSTGGAQGERLAGTVQAVRESTRELIAELSGGRAAADAIVESGRAMWREFETAADQLRGALPAALADVEAQAGRTGEAVASLAPMVERIGAGTANLEAQAGGIAVRVAEIAERVAAQDETSRTLLERLVGDVDALQDRFAAAGASGSAEAERLSAAVETLRSASGELEAGLATSGAQIDSAGARAAEIARTLRQLGDQLDEQLPAALARLSSQAQESRDAAAAIAPAVESAQAAAEATAARIAEAEASLERQREAAESLFNRIGEGTAGADEQLRALGTAAQEAQAAAARIAAETGPELIEALLRVREAGAQAAERAREAISAVIPSAAASLGEASRAALERAVTETVERQLAELAGVSERAVETARRASERLTRQMLALGETSAAVEARIDEERRERESKDSENFTRRVALLIESLNSTAIDVTKILSNEVTDSAWAAYLKGDRGVFTRRAVRLLDSSEAKEIARHYEDEPEFREQVNRYIHDFESMLRRILADRDGSPLGVTILSSDMGKLYVALAQAIERLR
jgi:hypothetical protein